MNQQVYYGMERNFPEMQRVLESGACPIGTVIEATDTGRRMIRKAAKWEDDPGNDQGA